MKQELETLQEIRNLMENSSRFIGLSGWSGIAAGCIALIGASLAYPIVSGRLETGGYYSNPEIKTLLLIGLGTFIAALILAFIFTYAKTSKTNIPVFGKTSKRLTWTIIVPTLVGGIFLLKLISYGLYGLVAPGCLIFYGIALFATGKQTVNETRYLAYCEIILGCISLWKIEYGLYFWAIGFGLFHILYGARMWYKYDRN
ncbi:MAG: hypothetical protein LBU57_10085 [Dysgonamonadaceae bacterium]|jgi:hypothetical protein|nr:hypothetical protein [Dysgonamonadaceae bacterium]